jgi:parallel beta-helix repeat protein
MATTGKIIIGFLIVTLIAMGLYIELAGAGVKLRVDDDYTTLYTYEGRWLISGREINSLFNGTKKISRVLAQTNVSLDYDNLTKITTIVRHTTFSTGATIDDTYVFDGTINDKERFPIVHSIHIQNAKGLIYQYDVDRLVYTGETEYLDSIYSKAFGRNVKITWNTGNYYSRIFKYSTKDEGKLTIKYRVNETDVTYYNRLFDPVSGIVFTSSSGLNNTDANWTVTWTETNTLYNHTFWDKASTGNRVLFSYPFITNFSGTTVVNFGSLGTSGIWNGGASTYWVNNTGFGSGTGYFQIDDGTDYINTTITTNLTRPFTTCVSFKASVWPASGVNDGLFSKWDSGASKRSWLTFITANATGDYIKYSSSDSGSDSDACFSSIISNDSAWYDVCVIYASTSDNYLYVNGLLNSTCALPSTTTIFATDVPIAIGTFFSSGAVTGPFEGTIANAEVYNWSLSAQQIKERYDALLARRPIKLMADETTAGDSWTVYVMGGNNTAYSTASAVQGIGIETAAEAPGDITDLISPSQGETWIYLTWTNPTDADYNHTEIFRNGTSISNTSITYYNSTGLATTTTYVFTLAAVDNASNRGNNATITVATNIGQPLYVNNSHASCSDAYTKTQAQSTSTPWCSFTTGLSNLVSGDTLYVIGPGFYVDTNSYSYTNKVLSAKTSIIGVNNPVIGNWISDYNATANGNWQNLSNSTHKIWNSSYSSGVTYILAMRISDNASYFAHNSWADFVNLNMPPGTYWDNTNNQIYIRFNDSTNPNNLPLYMVKGDLFTITNVSGAEFEVRGLTFISRIKGITLASSSNSSNVTIRDNTVIGTLKGIDVRYSHDIRIINNTVSYSRVGAPWSWDDMKGVLEEISGIYLYASTAGQMSNVNVSLNTIHGYFNGILQSTDAPSTFSGFDANYNTLYDIYDDALEIEYYCNGGTWRHNNITDAFVGISVSPANASNQNTCIVDHNLIWAEKSILETYPSTYTSGETIKLLPDAGEYVSNFNFTHNTFIGRGVYATIKHSQYNTTWKDNIFYSTGAGGSDRLLDKSGLAADDVFYDYNLYYHSAGDHIFRYWNNDTSSTEFLTLALARASSQWDGQWDNHSVNADPLFISYATGDFRIAASSPAHNTASDGTDIGALESTARILYVNVSHPSCSDAYTADQAQSLSTPWCTLDAPLTNDKAISGDIVYVCAGEYNGESDITGWTVTSDITIMAYPGHSVNLTRNQSLSTSWVSLGSGLWYANFTGVGSSYARAYLADLSAKFFTWDGTNYANFSASTYEYNVWTNMTGQDRVYLRFTGSAANFTPNASNVKIVTGYQPIQLDNNIVSSDAHIILSGFNYKYIIYGVASDNTSNVIIENSTFYGGHNAIVMDGSSVAGITGAVIRYNDFLGLEESDFIIDDIKDNIEETDAIAFSNYRGAAKVYNNTFTKYGGAVTIGTNTYYDLNGSEIYNNYAYHMYGSVFEIENFCYNSSWHHNTVVDCHYAGVSWAPANALASPVPCQFTYNVISCPYAYPEHATSNAWPYAIKAQSRVAAEAPNSNNVSNWNISQNTFAANGRALNTMDWSTGGSTYGTWLNTSWTNNIFYSLDSTTYSYTVTGTGMNSTGNFWDYNLYYLEPGGYALFSRYNNHSGCIYTTLAAALVGTCKANLWNLNSVEDDPEFTIPSLIGLTDLTPAEGSPACTMSSTGSYVGALPCAGEPPLSLSISSVSSSNGLGDSDANWTVNYNAISSTGNTTIWGTTSRKAMFVFTGDTSTIQELSSYAATGVNLGATITRASSGGWLGSGAYNFSTCATDCYLSFNSDSATRLTNNLTLEVMIYPRTIDNEYVIAKRSLGSAGYNIYLSSSGYIGIYGTASFQSLGKTYTAGTWNHIVVLFNTSGTGAKACVNGVCGSWTSMGALPDDSSANITIGDRQAGSSSYFDGLIDETRIYNYQLTEAQILENYNALVATRSPMLISGMTIIGETWNVTQWATDGTDYVSDSETFYINNPTPEPCPASADVCLDGVEANQKYEYGTTMSLQINVGGAETITVSSPVLGVNEYYDGLTEANDTIALEVELDNYYDNTMNKTTSTSLSLKTNQSIFWNYSNWYDITGLTFNLSSFNTTVINPMFYLNNVYNRYLLGTITGGYLKVSTFWDGASTDSLFFSSSNIEQYTYLNISTQTVKNLTFLLGGLEADPIELDYYQPFLTNETSNISTVVTGAYPTFVLDDFETNRYDVTSLGSLSINTYNEGQYWHIYDYLLYDGKPNGLYTDDNSGLAIYNLVNFRNYDVIGINMTCISGASARDYDNSYVFAHGIAYCEAIVSPDLIDGEPRVTLRQTYSHSYNDGVCKSYLDGVSDPTYPCGLSFGGVIQLKRLSEGSTTWLVYDDGVNTKNVTIPDATMYIGLYGSSSISCNDHSRNLACFASASVEGNIYDITLGGIGTTDLGNNVYNGTFNVTSVNIFNTTDNITAAILTSTTYDTDNSGEMISYYLSPNNGTTWETVESGLYHVFTALGKNLKWRVVGNSTDTTYNYGIAKLEIDISSSSPENVTIDIGDDGTNDANVSGVLNYSTTINITNSTPFDNYIDNYCSDDDTCIIPISFSSDAIGGIILSNLNVTSYLNPISLRGSNFTTTGNMTIRDDTSFNVTVNDWKLYLAGDIDNIQINTTFTYSDAPNLIDTKTVNMSYSPFNLTSAYPTLNFIPSSLNAKNVQPYGQSATIPYWNVTAITTHHITDFFINAYEDIPVCAILIATNTSLGTPVILTVAGQKIVSLSGNTNSGIWHYLNLTSCSSGFPIDVIINSLCEGCVQTIDFDSWSGEATP